MELNYGNILNIIIESESLESPDWIWKARVGGDFYGPYILDFGSSICY